jgi:AmiR/NasT family two-component response regulator
MTDPTIAQLHAEIANLRVALTTRDVIGQAKGILMERHGLTADEAFDRLVTMSQHTNVKVREVAQYLVELRAGVPSDLELDPTD